MCVCVCVLGGGGSPCFVMQFIYTIFNYNDIFSSMASLPYNPDILGVLSGFAIILMRELSLPGAL